MNEYEARGRAVKAFKLARVLVRLCRQFPQYDETTFVGIEQRVRLRTAEIAGVKPPSDATWEQALALLRVWLGPKR